MFNQCTIGVYIVLNVMNELIAHTILLFELYDSLVYVSYDVYITSFRLSLFLTQVKENVKTYLHFRTKF